jgi:hypothetical protein
MKNAVQLSSGVMMYIPSFIKIGSGIQTLIEGRAIHRHAGRRQHEILTVVIRDKTNFLAFMVVQYVKLCNATNLPEELTPSILKMQKYLA